MPTPRQDVLRRIPSVEAILQYPEFQSFAADVPRRIVVDCVRVAVEQTRAMLARGACGGMEEPAIRATILARARRGHPAPHAGLTTAKQSTPRASSCTRPWAAPCSRQPCGRSSVSWLAIRCSRRMSAADSAAARRADRVALAAAHRRRGGDGRQQQRRRHVIVLNAVAARQGSHRFSWAVGGNRRLVSSARRHGGQRGQTGRGGHHQQNPCPRLRAGDHAKTPPPFSASTRATTNHRLHGRSPLGRVGARSPMPAT